MELRPALQLKTAIKSLTDVVLPAIDPDNKLAQEQAHLVVAMLNLAVQRMPLMYRYDRDELARALAFADRLRNEAGGLPGIAEALHALARGAETGADVLDRARAEPGELEAANADLKEKAGALLTSIYSTGQFEKLTHINAIVMAHTREQLLRERSWLINQGWEPDPGSIPAIETLIG